MSQSPVEKFDQYLTSFVPKKQGAVVTVGVAIIQLLIALYAVRFAPNLPKAVQDLFTNPIARFVVFFIILVVARYQPSTALVVAIAFLLTTNYINTGKVFEFMENTQDTTAQLAAQGVQTPEQAMNDMSQGPQVVAGEVQLPPIVVTPQVYTTEDGKQVVGTPNVIIASKPVIQGDQAVMVTPNVQVVEAPAQQPTPAPAPAPTAASTQAAAAAPAPAAEVTPKEAVSMLAQAAASPAAVQPDLVQKVAEVAQAAVTTPEGAAAVSALAQQAAAPAAATTEQVQEVAQVAIKAMEPTVAETPVLVQPAAPAAEAPKFLDIGCYASRKIDMSAVQPFESEFFNATV